MTRACSWESCEMHLINIKMHAIWTLFLMQHSPHELFFNSKASKMLLDFKLGSTEHCQKGQTSLTLRRDNISLISLYI